MKAIGIIVFLSIAGLFPLASSSTQPRYAFLSNTLYVGGCGPSNYTKIQDAVDNASPGDTIFVYHGLYNEHVLITKQITLTGEAQDQTIINGSGTGNVIKIQTDGVTVQQFTLQHGGIGLYIAHSSNQTIAQNSITHNWEGIGLLDSSHNIITENRVTHNGFEGINPDQTTFTMISGNTIIDNLQGIYLVASTQNIVIGNIFQSNTRGIETQQSSNNHLFHNNFYTSEQNNAYDTSSNSWDDGYPSGGNYWDDYQGGDANHDGIGDTPYTIPPGINTDHYPLMAPWNHRPSQPADPLPVDGATNVPVNPQLSVFVSDPDGDTMNVSFFEASTQQLISTVMNVPSSTRVIVSWNGLENLTQYRWYTTAEDGRNTTQSRTWQFTTGTGENQPPAAPSITGPTSGTVRQPYNFTFVTTDPEGSMVSYFIDWGDATNSGWIGPSQSGEQRVVSHTWSRRGTYAIKAKAKDNYDTESGWGTLQVTMPLSYEPPHFRFFTWLFERFPHAFPILRYALHFN